MNQAHEENAENQPGLNVLYQRIADLEQTVADLTARMQEAQPYPDQALAHALQQSDTPYTYMSSQEFFETLPVPMVLYRTDGMLVAINRRNEQLLRISRDTVIGTFNMYEDREALQKGYVAYFQRAVEGQVVQMPPTSYDTIKAGHRGRMNDPVIWTETIYFPIRDHTGVVRYVGEINLDVTEQMRTRHELRQREDSLRHSQTLLQGVLDYSPAAIYVKDIDGVFLLANRRFAEIVHLTNEQIIGKQEGDLFAPEIVALWHVNDQHIIASGQPLQVEEVSPFDHELRSYLTIKFPLRDVQGMIYATSGIMTDITDRKRTEQALQHAHGELQATNAKLQRAARLKDEFLASMSHELRTPLNVILGLSQVLQEEEHGRLTEKQHMYARTIEESGQNLLTMINNILDFANIEAGRVQLDSDIVPVETMCHTSLSAIRDTARQKRLTIVEQLDSSITTLRADARRLHEMLVHLLNNAVKFTPEGGQVRLQVTGDSIGHAVHFTVEDTGIGITSEEMQRLFQPFVQVDSRLSRQYEGAGLGLVIVARLAELHGGSLSVESAEGIGSRFTISLPWVPTNEPWQADSIDSAVPALPLPAMRPQSLEAPLILLAEDNEATIAMIQEYLHAQHYQVVVARDGAEAVELAQAKRPALILMDIQMPVLDGLTAIQHIRSDSDLTDMPIIAVTALAMPGDRAKFLGAGANAYMSKPISLRALLQEIQRLLPEHS